MKNGSFSKFLGLAFAGAIALAAIPVMGHDSVAIGDTLASTILNVKDHALEGELTIMSHQGGEIAGIIFESRKNGQVVAFPKASIDAVNKAVSARTDLSPLVDPVVNIVWVRDMPGGGSIYSASGASTAVGFVIVQPNGEVEYKPI